MSPRVALGQCINQGPPGHQGFDAFAAHPPQGLFSLADGANSCLLSGEAARWLVEQMSLPGVPREASSLARHVEALHQQMLARFAESATTLLHVQLSPNGARLASVGDSMLHVLERRWWGAWRLAWSMPRDVDAQGHPSQLLGSEVLKEVHLRELGARGPLLLVMMSDGPGHVLGPAQLASSLSCLGRQMPSNADLDYLCQTLVSQALAQGCTDDASVALIWVDWP